MFRTSTNAIKTKSTQILTSSITKLQQIPYNHVSTKNRVHPFMQFFNNVLYARTGRSWTVHELRIKSQEDLEKLWFVLLKERNALSTYQHYCGQNKVPMKGYDRIDKCKASMRALLHVVNERKIAYQEITHNHKAMRKRSMRAKERKLEQHEERLILQRSRSTPNQFKNVNIQDKTWRKKTMGQQFSMKNLIIKNNATLSQNKNNVNHV